MSESLMNKWDQVQSPGRNELVFADRFKEYGAYQIRSQFSKNQSLATLIALSVTALFAAMPIIVEHFFPKEKEVKTQLKVTNIDDVKANFPGGEAAFRSYVEGEFQYPPRCYEEGINGAVLLRFAVDEAGRISRVQAIEETKSCPEFTTEAIRVLKKSPRWVPGQNNGTFLKSWREIPIKLAVE